MNFNKVIIGGRLTRDPAVKHLPSQTVVVEFGVACNRKYRTSDGVEKEETVFVDMTSFGRRAEVISQYLAKGSEALFEGRLKYDQWEDKQGGGKRSKLTVVIENFQFVGGRDGHGGEPASDADPPARNLRERGEQVRRRAAAPSQAPFGEERHFDEIDIPF